MKASDIEAAQIAQAHAKHEPLLVPATDAKRELDLSREVHALLGIVFDRIDLDSAAERIRRCAVTGRRCFLSTPNVNFVAAAVHDASFRGSVLRSDLSVADGFPIVRIGRAMGISFPGRVAGSDIFERLQRQSPTPQQPPIRLFLFGGPPGVGAQAARRLNAAGGGFCCVGHDEGGFGDIEAMSSPAAIDRINASGAQFVLVALGAKKGQAWIERNRDRLNAPVLSHLGAVINFAAASVERAPRWMQVSGLEWAWRVIQEPKLWRRYWSDGQLLFGAVWLRLLPWWLRRTFGTLSPGAGTQAGYIVERGAAGGSLVRLSGDWRGQADLPALRLTLANAMREGEPVEFDLSEGPVVGSALLGLIALIDAWQVQPRALRAASATHAALRSELRAHGVEHLLG